MNPTTTIEITPAVRQTLAALGMAGTKLAYSVEEAAEALGLGRTMLYGEIAAGRLRAKKIGKRTIILVDDARAYLASLPELPSAA